MCFSRLFDVRCFTSSAFVLDLLPPLGHELHDLFGVQVPIARLLPDFLALLLTEEDVWREWLARRLHPLQNDLFLCLDVVADEVTEFSVPLGTLLTLLE